MVIASGEALGPELVLLNLQRELPFGVAGDTASGDKVQKASVVELGRPTDSDLQARPQRHIVFRGKENAGTTDVEGLTDACN